MRYLTEAEAWEVVAQIFEMDDLRLQYRCGMCKTVSTMWRHDLISEEMREAMRTRINRRLNQRSDNIYFARYVNGHDPLRVKIARQFAKAAA